MKIITTSGYPIFDSNSQRVSANGANLVPVSLFLSISCCQASVRPHSWQNRDTGCLGLAYLGLYLHGISWQWASQVTAGRHRVSSFADMHQQKTLHTLHYFFGSSHLSSTQFNDKVEKKNLSLVECEIYKCNLPLEASVPSGFSKMSIISWLHASFTADLDTFLLFRLCCGRKLFLRYSTDLTWSCCSVVNME